MLKEQIALLYVVVGALLVAASVADALGATSRAAWLALLGVALIFVGAVLAWSPPGSGDD